jgi:hypothetical protein
VGALAGHSTGPVKSEGKLLLITESYNLIEPRKGKFPVIEELLMARLGTEQIKHFYAWLKLGYEALRAGRLDPGLMLILVGPPNVHKTCVQELIITGLLGGREAQPYSFFAQKTDFNRDLIEAEHWIISDASHPRSPNSQARIQFGGVIKRHCGTNRHRIHSKGKDATYATIFSRISLGCNEEWQHINVVPDLEDQTVADKILLLDFKNGRLDTMPTDREGIAAVIKGELPSSGRVSFGVVGVGDS